MNEVNEPLPFHYSNNLKTFTAKKKRSSNKNSGVNIYRIGFPLVDVFETDFVNLLYVLVEGTTIKKINKKKSGRRAVRIPP